MRDERNRKIWIWVYVGHKKIISNRERYKSQHSLNSKNKTKQNKKSCSTVYVCIFLTHSQRVVFAVGAHRKITGPASRYILGPKAPDTYQDFNFNFFFFLLRTDEFLVRKGFQDKLVLKNSSSNRITNFANTESISVLRKGASGAALEWNVSLFLVRGVRLYEGTCPACHMCHRKKSISQHFIIKEKKK